MRTHHALRIWGSRPLVGLLICGWALALAACAPQAATSTPSPMPYFSAVDVSMDSPADGWAVGQWITPASTPGHQPTFQFAMAHLQQGQWHLESASVTGDHNYQLVRMLTPADGWAATLGDIEHYDGTRWDTVFPLAPAQGGSVVIRDLAFPSPTDGWAVGDYGILQLAHGVWRDVTASLPPRPADWLTTWNYPGLRSVTAVSTTDAWAVGDGGAIWQYDGAHWRMATSPYFPNNIVPTGVAPTTPHNSNLLPVAALTTHTYGALFAAQMVTSVEGWSVGGPNVDNLHSDQYWGPSVVEHYQAGSWQITHIVSGAITRAPGAPTLTCLAMTSSREGWIGGAWAQFGAPIGTGDAAPITPNKIYHPLLLHYHAGQWTFVAVPAVGAIHRLVMLSPQEGWAAADGGLLHYIGGQWRLERVHPGD